MIANYEIVTAKRVADLQERVQERIRQGWQPIGGVAMLHEEASGERPPHMVFAQAVVSQS